jgi:hypothetical protein
MFICNTFWVFFIFILLYTCLLDLVFLMCLCVKMGDTAFNGFYFLYVFTFLYYYSLIMVQVGAEIFRPLINYTHRYSLVVIGDFFRYFNF